MWINPTGNAPPIKFEKSGRTPTQSAAPCSSSPDKQLNVGIFLFSFLERGVEKGVFYLSPPPLLLLLYFSFSLSLSLQAFIPLRMVLCSRARRLALFLRRRVASFRVSPSNTPPPARLVFCLNRIGGIGKTRHCYYNYNYNDYYYCRWLIHHISEFPSSTARLLSARFFAASTVQCSSAYTGITVNTSYELTLRNKRCQTVLSVPRKGTFCTISPSFT